MSRILGQRSVEGLLVDWSAEQPLPDRHLPVGLLSREQKAAELQRVQRLEAMCAAYEAELVMGLADDTPDTLDPPPGHPGARKGSWAPDTELPGVSEFFTAELAMVLNCGRLSASNLAHRSYVYRESLPATRAAMGAGLLDEGRAKVLADVLQHTSRRWSGPSRPNCWTRRRGCPTAGHAIGRWPCCSSGTPRRSTRREDAKRHADVRSYPSHLQGMSTLAADLPAEEAAAGHDLIDQLAQMVKADGDPRPIGQIRAEVFPQLIRRPWNTGLPRATAHLHITAALDALAGRSATPGEVNGHPITAAPPARAADPPGRAGPARTGGRVADLRPHRRQGAAAVHRHARAAGEARPPRLPAAPRLRVLRSRPAAGHRRLHPHRRPADVHPRPRPRLPVPQLPAAGRLGRRRPRRLPRLRRATDSTNLCCLCRSHHRLKTHARGWRFVMDDDVLHVTTPSGITRTTRPPGMRPPEQPEAGEPPPTPTVPDDDPPPF